jgi:hypothetical protein
MQKNLALSLWYQSQTTEGKKRKQLLTETVEACRAALKVLTYETWPQDWAEIQNSLAIALNDLAEIAEGRERKQLLNEAVVAKRAAFDI